LDELTNGRAERTIVTYHRRR